MERANPSTRQVNYGLALLDVNKKCGQATSGTYAACEQLIQMSFMVMQLSTLDQILERFEKNGRLTRAEHQSLMKLARQIWNSET